MQALGERRCVNRPWLNGLCVAARVCLLYMLFDPDMISWRERGPGGASLRTLCGPAPSFSLPRSPGPAALCPSPEPWAASSRTGLARRALCWGQRRGQAAGGGATFLLNVSPRILSGSPLRTMSLWPRLIGFRWALGLHPVGLNSAPSSRSDGLPSAQARSQQRLAEGLSTVWQSSKATAFSIQLYIARLPWPPPGGEQAEALAALPPLPLSPPLLPLSSQRDPPKVQTASCQPLG